jgi:hypothetical protein
MVEVPKVIRYANISFPLYTPTWRSCYLAVYTSWQHCELFRSNIKDVLHTVSNFSYQLTDGTRTVTINLGKAALLQPHGRVTPHSGNGAKCTSTQFFQLPAVHKWIQDASSVFFVINCTVIFTVQIFKPVFMKHTNRTFPYGYLTVATSPAALSLQPWTFLTRTL